MTRQATITVISRAATTAFFLLTSAYCILSYNTFAYVQFIQPQVLAWPSDFVALHHVFFLLAWLLCALTLIPFLRRPSFSWAAAGYLAVAALVGGWLFVDPLLATIDNSRRSLVAGLVTLIFPFALALVDHHTASPPELTRLSEMRFLRACGWTAVTAWATYATAALLRSQLGRASDFSAGAWIIGMTASALVHAMVFAALFLVIVLSMQVLRACGGGPRAEYRLVVGVAASSLALVIYFVAFGAIGFTEASAGLAALCLGVTLALAWSGTARRVVSDHGGTLDALDVFLAPMHAPKTSWGYGLLVGLPAAPLALAALVEQLDWDFLLQKLGVLIVWLLAFAIIYAGRSRRQQRLRSPSTAWVLGAPATVLTIFVLVSGSGRAATAWVGDARLSPTVVLDRYASVDPAFRLIRTTARANFGEAAAFYGFLRAHSTISHVQVDPVEIDFVRPLGPPPGRRPHLFLFVIDSLRRDYLSPYNDSVTFTPATAEFARDSFVFDRAFTRYGATGLSLPSIWVGGMTLHMQYIRPFTPMNTLLKLLEAGGYRQYMSVDGIVDRLNGEPSPLLVELDKGRPVKQYDFCLTLAELGDKLGSHTDERPVFGYSLPQNVHIANAFETPVPDGESYPGFVDNVAAQVRRIDGCFGAFVDRLKTLGLYDDSVIVLTSDHGDSLGEEGRFGHAYTVFPEVMRVPLIIHLPTWLADRVTTDLTRVSFTADITPTFYALLGYEPLDRGPLYGVPLFEAAGTAMPEHRRRRDPFLMSSSYGAVYGMLRHNGRSLYIADAVAGRDYAYDLSEHPFGRRMEITEGMRDLNWRLIREQVAQIAAQYRFQPAQH